jgi:hypothetical protein
VAVCILTAAAKAVVVAVEASSGSSVVSVALLQLLATMQQKHWSSRGEVTAELW